VVCFAFLGFSLLVSRYYGINLILCAGGRYKERRKTIEKETERGLWFEATMFFVSVVVAHDACVKLLLHECITKPPSHSPPIVVV